MSYKDKKLYVCIQESFNHYGLWSVVDLDDLLSCSCMFDEKCSRHVFHGPDSHGRGETMKLCYLFPGKDGFGNKVPYWMGCHMDDSCFILAGGFYPNGKEGEEEKELITASHQVFLLKGQYMGNMGNNTMTMSTKYPKHSPWICHFLDYIYVMGRPHLIQPSHPKHKPQVDNQFEVFNFATGSWIPLPNPPPINSRGPNLIYYTQLGSMIVASVKAFGEDTFTLHSFDILHSEMEYVVSKHAGLWVPVKLYFDGKHFPFIEGALVLHLKGTRDMVMFTYHEDVHDIQVCQIAMKTTPHGVNIRVKHHQLLGLPSKFPHLADLSTPEWGSTFGIVHLENQKVCLLQTLPFHTRENRALNAEYRSLVAIVLEYKLVASGCFSCKFVATRVFGYRSHYSPTNEPTLIGCSVT